MAGIVTRGHLAKGLPTWSGQGAVAKAARSRQPNGLEGGWSLWVSPGGFGISCLPSTPSLLFSLTCSLSVSQFDSWGQRRQ